MIEEHRLPILHDHYKETFGHIQSYLKLRDRLFAYLLLTVTVMLFQMYSPTGSTEAISELLTKKLELKTPIDVSFLSSVVWFVLLSLVVRYFQTVVHVERQYDYIHKIEDELSTEYGRKAFTREGKSYLENYPLFSSWAWVLYTIVFPLLLSIVVVTKIVGEIRQSDGITVLLSINAVVALGILLSCSLYALLVHFKK